MNSSKLTKYKKEWMRRFRKREGLPTFEEAKQLREFYVEFKRGDCGLETFASRVNELKNRNLPL